MPVNSSGMYKTIRNSHGRVQGAIPDDYNVRSFNIEFQ